MATWTQAFSAKSGYVLYLTVTETGTSVANNTSTVSWSAKIVINDYLAFSGYSADLYVTLDGVDRLRQHFDNYAAGDGQTVPYTKAIGSGTATITHNSDGKKSLSCRAGVTVESGTYSPGSAAISQSLTLTAIPRASTVTATDGVTGGEIHIGIQKAVAAFRHRLRWKIGEDTGIIAENVDTEYTWEPATEDFAPLITDAASAQCIISCDTYNGSTLIGTKSVTVMLTVDEAVVPVVQAGWYTISRQNQGGASGINAGVQGFTKLSVGMDGAKVSGQYGAEIERYGITVEGRSYESDTTTLLTEVLLGSGDIQMTVYVIDSRGRRAEALDSVTLYPYSPPAIVSRSIYRSDAAGEADDTGTYIAAQASVSVSTLGGLNTGVLRFRYREKGGSWSTYTTIQPNTLTIFGGGLVLVSKSYEAEIVLSDTIGSETRSSEQIPTDSVAFHIREGGRGAAFFGYAENDGVLKVYGDIAAEDGAFSGDVSAADGSFTGNISAATGSFTGNISAAAGSFTGNISAGNLADTVVEEGTSGSWQYRKWQSGRLEQWGKITGSLGGWNAWGTAYESGSSLQGSFPVAFISAPVMVATGVCSQGGLWLEVDGAPSTTKTPLFYANRPNAKPGMTSWTVHVYAVGKWE